MAGHIVRERLAAGLERHVLEEERILGHYRNLAGALRSGPAALLVRLIFRDEEQHHFLLRDIAQKLKEAPEERVPIEGLSRLALLRMVKRLAAHEEKTIRQCRKLRSRLVARESELVGAILSALISDSEKHRGLLLALDRVVKRDGTGRRSGK